MKPDKIKVNRTLEGTIFEFVFLVVLIAVWVFIIIALQKAPDVVPTHFDGAGHDPNPFSHQTTVPFSLPNAAEVKLFVMDALGHIVYTDSRFCYAGNNLWTINMDRFSSGVYYYGIEVDGIRQMRKMILH